MVRLRRAFSGILFLTLIIGLASANWRFYGTQFRLSEDKEKFKFENEIFYPNFNFLLNFILNI